MSLIEDLIYVFLVSIMIIVMIYCIGIISSKKPVINMFKLIIGLILSEIIVINNIYNYVSLRLIFSIMLSTILIKFIFEFKFKDALKYTLIYYVITTALELLLSFLLMIGNLQGVEVLNENVAYKFGFSLIHCVFTIIIFKSKSVLLLIKKFLYLIYNSVTYYNLFAIILIFLNIIMIFKCKNLSNDNIVILTTICIVFMAITIRTIVNDKYIIKVLSDRNKNLCDSYKAYADTVEEYRNVKHNLRNELYGVKTNLPKKYQKDIDKIIIKNNKDLDWVTKLNEIPEGLQGIIFLKKNEGEKKKIKFSINTTKKIENVEADYIDLCDTVGILIDNAIEASTKVKNRIVDINIKETSDKVSIEITNTFQNKIDVNKIGKKNYSTKEIKSGLGINYITTLHNDRIKVTFKIIDNLFKVKVVYTTKKATKKGSKN